MAHSCGPDIFPNIDSASIAQPPRDAEASLNCDHRTGLNVPDTRAPVSGMNRTKSTARHLECIRDSVRTRLNASPTNLMRASQGRLPKIQFPVFNGEDPQLWKSRCESYIKMYRVESSLWIEVSTMHLEGVVACWFQSVEHRVRGMSWEEFCA
jgi:hypothetical protein